MPWIRLEAENGLRVMAPSFSASPRMEGIDKLFEYPVRARSFHCFRGCAMPLEKDDNVDSRLCLMEEILVLVQRQQMGGKLGEVTIAVGGPAASRDELTVVLDSAFDVVRRTNYSGARLIFDALCTSSAFAPAANDEVVEYDGLPTLQESHWKERRVSDWRDSDKMSSNKGGRSEVRSSLFVRRRALLFFVTQDVVPVNLLYCRVSGVKSHGCVSSVAKAAQHYRKGLQSLESSAARACKNLVDVIDRTLVAAYNVNKSAKKHQSLWGGNFDKITFVAVFSINGLLFASPLFFQLTDHRNRLFIAAVAVDQLSRWPTERSLSKQTPLIHVCDLLLKCGKDGLVLNLVFLGVGNAVSCVFAFRTAGEEAFWDAAVLLRFIKEHLRTPRAALRLGAGTDDGDDDEEEEEATMKKEAREFAPHFLLCTASIYPTTWFHRLLYEMNKLEEEAPKTFLQGTNDVSNGKLPPRLHGTCDCLPFFGQHGKKTVKSTPFVWSTDTVDLPLNIAWCVASSHIVKEEANACSEGREMGHYALFSILSGIAGNEGELGRYGVGWFNHCWRHTSIVGTRGDKENGVFDYYTTEADPTKFLGGLASIGGGPCAPGFYEVREGGGCFFRQASRFEARAGDDGPFFTSKLVTFPYSLLFEGNGAEDDARTDEENGGHLMTALYTMNTHKVKDAECNALLQEMLLMEGDLTEWEEELIETLRRRQHRSPSVNAAFALCHEAARCVLEDVWRCSIL
ncbi:hypothetical protein C3747_12g326 [Trypanosoma cruzi]|uniref:Uncharacterized protein n=2 Tax=Trypanosoma cruzi TaxID=5693 RepID=Q4D541_TRYCC|nr:hypothetical protein, conserved [Trypanosoma cruzi]EAN87648.1 hypothetical protein, conserved [Trypanosoma cruzi]PWV18841.1 hypothetical protein C3747_12g326 [Trypanosoma cruzi]RNC41786.1 hypothetical protein TcCL_NonESM08610 [Trypanosoma cruzi]|eukprot:XP_809499.1 hypothetical protein [Trypanosoma cruzi strain CL Brener]